MKSVLRWCVVPLLSASLIAQTAGTSAPKKAAAKRATGTITAQDVQELRDALAAQQRQIEQLKQQMQSRDSALQQAQQQAQQAQQQLQQAQSAATDAQQKAAAAETAANDQKAAVSKLSSDMQDVQTTLTNNAVGTQDEQKRMSALEGLVGRFRFSGDVRVRNDDIIQKGTQDRVRGRIRVRLGIDGKLNEDFTGGMAIATGSFGDPTTTNETLTNFFARKTIGLDRGYITYAPIAHKWLSITGGKFAYTWQRTSMTFDPDINPEGFSEKFSFDLRNKVVKNVSLTAIQLLVNEVTAASDSYAIGGQLSSKLQLGKFWTATPSFSALKFNKPDTLLTANGFQTAATSVVVNLPASAGGGTITVPLPGEGPGCKVPQGAATTACVFAPNNFTNAATFVGAPHFYSQFLYADFILNNQFKTPSPRFPVNLLLEYLENPQAKPHPLSSTGAVLTGLGSQNKGYLVDFSVGQQKNKNDVQLGYAWLRQEQDSAISSWVESDQRAPTNIVQNRIYGLWKVRANTTAAVTYYFGRTLNTALQNAQRAPGIAVGAQEPKLNRLLFDLIYSF